MFARPWIVVPSLLFFCGLFIWFLWAQAKTPGAGPHASDTVSADSPNESRAVSADSPNESQASPEYFAGPFQETVVVPTLDTPMPKGKNVIWCGTFAMAWGELSTKVVKEPIRLKDAGEICGRLNAAA
jgi:hypothetical protein